MQSNNKNNSSGKFIVIDGTDGTGKATQANLLGERLMREGFHVKMADFPQYGQKSAGPIEDYLNGKYGTADAVGPYRASIFFAIDRYDASFKIRRWLQEGNIVICNRYVTANMGHQGGKIRDASERKRYFEWLFELEYGIFNIPKPDLNIILHLDPFLAQQLVDKKGHRDYVNGAKRDIHEADINHLKNAEKAYLQLVDTFPGFSLLECAEGGVLPGPEIIHDKLWQIMVEKILAKKSRAQEYKHLTVRFKRITANAKLPTREPSETPRLNIFSDRYHYISPGSTGEVGTGLQFFIPQGFIGFVVLSEIYAEQKNSPVKIIDSASHNELRLAITNHYGEPLEIFPGKKIAQLVVQKIK